MITTKGRQRFIYPNGIMIKRKNARIRVFEDGEGYLIEIERITDHEHRNPTVSQYTVKKAGKIVLVTQFKISADGLNDLALAILSLHEDEFLKNKKLCTEAKQIK